MKPNKFLYAILVIAMVFACKKTDTTKTNVPNTTSSKFLICKKWQATIVKANYLALGLTDSSDMMASLTACQKDVNFQIKADGTTAYIAGTTYCGTALTNGTWSMSVDSVTLILSQNLFAPASQYATIFGNGPYSYTILNLSATLLKLRQNVSANIDTAMWRKDSTQIKTMVGANSSLLSTYFKNPTATPIPVTGVITTTAIPVP